VYYEPVKYYLPLTLGEIFLSSYIAYQVPSYAASQLLAPEGQAGAAATEGRTVL
jgi:hypothetical protein